MGGTRERDRDPVSKGKWKVPEKPHTYKVVVRTYIYACTHRNQQGKIVFSVLIIKQEIYFMTSHSGQDAKYQKICFQGKVMIFLVLIIKQKMDFL